MNGLTRGVEYIIWLRMRIHTSSDCINFNLMAQEITVATRPDRKLNLIRKLWDSNKAYIFCYLAPSGTTVITESSTTVTVMFPSPAGIFQVDSFEASIQNGTQRCSVLVSTVPHECQITGLAAGTFYTILAISSGEGVQSVHVQISFFTWPQGNHVSS